MQNADAVAGVSESECVLYDESDEEPQEDEEEEAFAFGDERIGWVAPPIGHFENSGCGGTSILFP